jgi:hypothetical protein
MDRSSDHRPVCGGHPTTLTFHGECLRGKHSGDADEILTGPSETLVLQRRSRPSKTERLPRGWVVWLGGLVSGVWLFFENSTGCLISQCQDFVVIPGRPELFWSVGFLWQHFVLSGWIFRFLLESLILAQDERWRRA